MTKQEFAQLAMGLKRCYPRDNFLPDNESMELWYQHLGDLDYKLASASVNKWISLNKWAPTIADIREYASNVVVGDLPDWGEAWEEVCKAIRYYGSYRADEALDSMSPLARKTAERMGFLNLCMSENVSADRANFRMIFEELASREKVTARIPVSLLDTINRIRVESLMGGATNDREGIEELCQESSSI